MVCSIGRQTWGSKLKKQTQHNIHWSQVGILATVLIFSILNFSSVHAQSREFIDPKSEYGKLAGIVSQLDGTGAIGNAFVIGAGGCHIVTNVHVAFGKSRDADGTTVLMDNVSVGHTLKFQFDFDTKTKRIKREMKASVVEFGNYDPQTRRGRTQDVVVLKLADCLGPQYGNLLFDQDASKKRFPEGELLTISFSKLNGEFGLVSERCKSASHTPITGLFITNCHSADGMSGMLYLEKSIADGKFRVVGIHQGRETMADGQDVPVAVYARAFNPIIDSALGEGSPIAIGPIATDRKPQNDQTALLAPVKSRTVVR